ncbi:putative transcriptional regulator [Nocardioides scoriae]|uniref:Putative transcriptional regulator n=1 Tax=Nocardioides scoriae TaxID=642780 RepID=A0A1H1X4Z5_9ACTN|nr:YqgE/AlgH family protein [Nocardioides scoriae]SDT04150.1 putative transcriptional regulator [Nocardioides scoriae]
MQPARGSLLISSATLQDPRFARTLVLVLDSDDSGSLGVVLNRPATTPVGEVLASWSDLTSAPQVLFEGGPVEGNAALAVARLSGAGVPEAWQPLSATLGILDLDRPPEEYVGLISALRVYAGYAGWGPGQLDDEIDSGSWHLAPAEDHDLFSDDPGGLWRQVLRRQPGPVAMLSTLPEDASLN